MGKVSGARGYHACCATAATGASTLCTVQRGLRHSQAHGVGYKATPSWQVPACVSSLPPLAEQRGVGEAHITTTNTTGHHTAQSTRGQLNNNPQHNPQEWVFSLKPRPTPARSLQTRACGYSRRGWLHIGLWANYYQLQTGPR